MVAAFLKIPQVLVDFDKLCFLLCVRTVDSLSPDFIASP